MPESTFTTSLEPDDFKILVLTLENFKDFLIRYNAPGVFPERPLWRGKKVKPLTDWQYLWEGLPKEYTVDGERYFGLNEFFAGIEFSQELVDFRPENGFKVIEEIDKALNPKIIYEFDLPNTDGTVRHIVADVSFLRYLEVRSGCVFVPQKLFHHPPSHYLAPTAGAIASARRDGRRTRRGRIIARRTSASLRRRG